MNSTEDGELREVIGALFDDVLMPMAERMRVSGARAFPVKPDVSRLSYYTRRHAQCSMARDDFTAPSCADFEDFECRLAAYWKDLGRHELADQVTRIAAVARVAHAAFTRSKQDAEVSPFVYVMF